MRVMLHRETLDSTGSSARHLGVRLSRLDTRPLCRAVRRFGRRQGGAVAIEIPLSSAMLISVVALSFDFYPRIKPATASARVAVGVANYVSRDTTPPRR